MPRVDVLTHKAQFIAQIIKRAASRNRAIATILNDALINRYGRPYLQIQKIDPMRIRNWSDFQRVFGNLQGVLQIARQQGIITDEEERVFGQQARQEIDVAQLAKRVDPEYVWKFAKSGSIIDYESLEDQWIRKERDLYRQRRAGKITRRQYQQQLQQFEDSLGISTHIIDREDKEKVDNYITRRNRIRNDLARGAITQAEHDRELAAIGSEFSSFQRNLDETNETIATKRRLARERRQEIKEEREYRMEMSEKRLAALPTSRRRPIKQAREQIQRRKEEILNNIQNQTVTENLPISLQVAPVRRTKQNTGTYLTTAARSVLQSGRVLPLDQMSLVTEGKLDAKAIQRAIKKPLVSKDGKINEAKVELEAVKQSTREHLQRSVYRDKLAQSIQSGLDINSNNTNSADRQVFREIGELVADATYAETRRVYDDRSRVSYRVAFDDVKDHVETFARAGQPFYSRIKRAVVKGIVRADPSLPYSEAVARAEKFLPDVVNSLRETPHVNIDRIEFSTPKMPLAGVAPVMTVHSSALSPDLKRISRDTTKIQIGDRPARSAKIMTRAWQAKDWLTDKGKLLDDYVFLGEVPEEIPTDVRARGYARRQQAMAARRQAFTIGLLDEMKNFEDDPVKAYLSYWYRIPLQAIAPDSIKNAYFKAEAIAQGREWRNKYGMPYFQTDQWLTAFAQGKIYEGLSHFTSLVTYDPKGRILPGPIGWISDGWDVTTRGVGQYFMKNATDKMLKSKDGQGSFGTRVQFRAGKKISDPRRSFGPAAVIAGLAAALVEELGVAVLKKLGIYDRLAYLSDTIKGMQSASKYGTGWCTDSYFDDLATDPRYKNISGFTNRMKPTLKWVGEKVISPLSSASELGKIGLKSGLKGTLLGLGLVLVGTNPILAWGAGGVYFAANNIRSFLTNPKFGGEWLFEGSELAYKAGRLANPASPYFRITEFFRNRGIPLDTFVEALNAPLDQFRKIDNLGDMTKWSARLSRFLPLDGLMISLFLGQVGIPIPFAAIPIGVDLAIKVLKEVSRLELIAKIAAGFNVFTAGLGMIGDFILTSYSLAEVGGIPGALAIPGWTWKKFWALIGQPIGTFVSTAGFIFSVGQFAALVGLAANPITALAALGIGAAVTATYYLTDTIMRLVTGEGIWEHYLRDWLTSLWQRLSGQGGAFMAQAASFLFGLLGLISAVLKGDIQGIVISVVMIVVGFGAVTTFLSTATGLNPVSSYTPTEGVGFNAFLLNTSKKFDTTEFVDSGGTKLEYTYSFQIRDFGSVKIGDEEIEISSLEITEEDVFTVEGEASVGDIFFRSELSDSSYEITQTESKYTLTYKGSPSEYSSGRSVSRTFSIILDKRLDELMPSPDDMLCNTINIKIDKVLDADGKEVSHNERPVSRRRCIDNEGNTIAMSVLTVRPVRAEDARFIPENGCFGDTRGEGGRHGGFDISSYIGRPVYAAGPGVVTYTNLSNEGYGNIVTIDHGNGLKTRYAHLSAILVELNDDVEAGDVIGEIGNTGNSTGPHLHFETERNGQRYDPCCEIELDLCSGYYSGVTCDDFDPSKCPSI